MGLERVAAAVAERPRVAAIIPAFNEEKTVGYVVDAIRKSPLVDEVIVVDNASRDLTGVVAAEHGARLLHQPIPGKGQAMQMGVAATDAPILLFLDADLTGLRADHVNQLVQGVLDGAAMTRGTIDRGMIINTMQLHLPGVPTITGQRAMRREVFEALDPEVAKGFGVETALNHLATERHLPVQDSILEDLSHRTKESKYATPWDGAKAKARMFAEVFGNSIRLKARQISGHGG